MTWKTLFNPFLKFDEKKLLIIGIFAFGLNILGSYYADSINDSIFHYSNLDEDQGIWDILKINSLSYLLSIVVIFILAKILNNKTRFIDIFNTILISQIPLMIMIPVSGLPLYKKALENLSENLGEPEKIQLFNITLISIWGFFSLILFLIDIPTFYHSLKLPFVHFPLWRFDFENTYLL